ncbi:MAG: polysaccharide lyase 8 family protein [Flavobacterium sp.]|uniref:polysaccharide lyase 8 family protein n=1 Tax=Flavobacterium sp. TaxID=239 RepID=UPI001B21A422|nr:polysaccharide lyase 8 family protein [Flavobacterium sp.]MBO9586239.1 polysaccharide lyase 8 family protein [Flavobacterium sp.]
MRKKFFCSILFIILLQFQVVSAQQDEFDIVRKNISNHLIQITKVTSDDLLKLQQSQKSDGSWSDIDYGSSAITLWQPITHLQRIKNYSIAINKEPNDKLNEQIIAGLQYWLKTAPKSKNWWYNDIATPLAIGEILVLLDEANLVYPKECKDALLESMKRGDPYKEKGANKLDIAMHYLYRACASKDEKLMDLAVNQLFAPIEFSTLEGLQNDYSYFQHGKQLYLAGYGVVFLMGEYKAASAVKNTKFALSNEKLKLLHTYLTQTFLRAIRGRYSDFNIEGRSISRPDILDKKNAIPDGYAENMLQILAIAKSINPFDAVEIENAIKRIKEDRPASFGIESFHKQFYCADYTLHQRKNYAFNVRTVSSRTKRTETGNGENLFGQFLADGATNIQRTGNEYFNIMPLWEWDKIPGITSRDYPNNLPAIIEWGENGSTDFVGGISDEKYGCTVYDMNYNDVRAKKTWFFFDKEIVCLGTGINSNSEENITTTLNQCWLKGEVKIGNHPSLVAETEKLENPSWIWHDRIGYYFLQQTKATVSTNAQKGSWKYINKGYSDADIEGKVFKLFIDHGAKPINKSYAYCVLPDISLKKMNKSVDNIDIVANNNEVQAVANNGLKMMQICFYKPQALIYKQLKITVDQPSLMLIKNINENQPEIWISDPSQKLSEITILVEMNNKTISKKIRLPDNENKGQSVKIN